MDHSSVRKTKSPTSMTKTDLDRPIIRIMRDVSKKKFHTVTRL